jgi:integrase
MYEGQLVRALDGTWMTKPPNRCPNGHTLGPQQVLVGHQACLGHLRGVPLSVVAAWLGHADASVTARIYAHSQPDALKAASVTLGGVVTSTVTTVVPEAKTK